MFTPIHRALGIEPGAITHHLIDAAVDRRVEETGDLDWKTALYDSRKPTWQDEVAKDVAAMANSGGGWIVFGVEEDGEANGASKVTPVEWNAAAQQRILRAAYARVGPPVLGLEFFPLDVEEGHVVLLRVPDSRDAPHFARKGDDAFVAPRRNGPHTVFMSDREIERSFRERFQRFDDREHQLQALFKQAGQCLNPEQGVVIVMAALPAESGSGLAPMSEEEAHKFFRQPLLPSLVFPGGQPLRRWESTRVRKGMRHWLLRSEENDRRAFRKAVHDDGTVLAAYRLGALTDREEAAAYYPVGQPNHCLAADIESALIDFISVLRAHAKERQSNAGYRVRVGLIGRDSEPIFVRTNEGSTNYLLDADHSEPIHHFQPVTTDLNPLESIEVLLPGVNDLARDVINQGGIKYLKVMAEPDDPVQG